MPNCGHTTVPQRSGAGFHLMGSPTINPCRVFPEVWTGEQISLCTLGLVTTELIQEEYELVIPLNQILKLVTLKRSSIEKGFQILGNLPHTL